MAICGLCHREMLKAKGCGVSKIHAGGKVFRRIPVGGHGDFYENENAQTRCSDCGARFGAYHHWGCDCERCPVCGRQLISCDCEDVFAEGSGPV